MAFAFEVSAWLNFAWSGEHLRGTKGDYAKSKLYEDYIGRVDSDVHLFVLRILVKKYICVEYLLYCFMWIEVKHACEANLLNFNGSLQLCSSDSCDLLSFWLRILIIVRVNTFLPLACDSFCIANDTLVLAKDGDGIFVQIFIQKLTVVHVSVTKHLLKVDTCYRWHISVMLFFLQKKKQLF